MLNDIFKTPRPASLILGLALGCGMTAAFPFDDTPASQVPVETAAAPAATSAAASIAAPEPAKDWDRVMQLGNIQVDADREEESRKIVAGLKVIKRALKANLSNDPADANQVVCRVNYDTGSHLTAHLMCSTNREIMVFKDTLHSAQLVHTLGQPTGGAVQALEHMNGSVSRDRYFSTKVSASELQKLLLQVQCDGCSNSGLVVSNN